MIMGGGIIGQTIAEQLQNQAHVKILEADEEKARAIADQLPNTLIIHGDGTDLELLREEGLHDMDSFIAVTGHDENNIISALLAHHSNVSQSIALVNKLDYLSVIPALGIDSVVSKQLLTVNAVEHLIQQEIADIATPPGLDAQLIEFIAGERSKIVRKPLRKIRFPQNAIVGAVMRGDKVIIPHGDTQLQPNDRAVIFTLPGAAHQVDLLFEG
jgi:trk system potassium uptake protein TrkA